MTQSHLPPDAKDLSKFGAYGIDPNGLYIFFQMVLADHSTTTIHCNHVQLGDLILHLQSAAKLAQARRLSLDPKAQHLEVRATPPNPVRFFDLQVDVEGKSAALLCTEQSGSTIQLQLPFDILEGLLANLPGLVAEMKRRQGAKSHSQ